MTKLEKLLSDEFEMAKYVKKFTSIPAEAQIRKIDERIERLRKRGERIEKGKMNFIERALMRMGY